MNMKLKSFALSVAALLVAGCTTFVPVQDFENQPVNRDLTEEQVKKAIKLGAGVVGWTTQEVKPGHILATYRIRVHTVIVDIPYSADRFAVRYKDTREMKVYCSFDDKRNSRNLVVTGRGTCPDGKEPVYIHANYNQWVQSLIGAISAAVEAV